MPEMLLKQVEIQVSWEVTVETQTPLQVYTAWAAELGVSPTDTLYNFASDDNSWSFNLAASPYLDSEVIQSFFSSEAGMGFYRQSPPGFFHAYYSLNHVGRLYGHNSRPLLLLTWHPTGGDLRSYGTRFQRAGQFTIAYVQHSHYSSSSMYRYDAALRISPGRIELVGDCLTQTTPVYLTELTELATVDTIRQYVLLESQAVGTRRRYDLSIAPPRIFALAGTAKFSDGQVATLVRAWRRDGGAWVKDAVPDPLSGAFVLNNVKEVPHDVTIFRDGYRPQTHGPVMPYEVL